MANHSVHFKKAGSTFAVPLADGRFGACRVLRADSDREMSLFAATEYVDSRPPDITNPLLRTILTANGTYYLISLGRCVKWQHWIEPPPRTFKYVGVVEPSAAEARINLESFSKFWDHWPDGILAEWRWRYDRPALVAEFDRNNGPGAWQRFFETRTKQKQMTLEKLKKATFFSNWNGAVPAAAIRESRKLIREAVEALIALGPKPTKKLSQAIVRRCVEGFNGLDEKHEFITTIEREDIIEQIDEALRVAGLKDYDDWADRWRDW
ncbi:hypothetical protein [Zavarzinella formosa]|uniref:hypothetical protein n=1 Tax=Zavarzinella formosa TaxID=360055 RepID=UPI0002EF0943|nr:hypothetical protein [Zavarzinella formosa]